jgi:G3E family GTPase
MSTLTYVPDDEKTPVTIVTGFLGSGKTTLMNRILKEQHGRRIAVVENEFGEINIDNELLSERVETAERIVSMDNGCVCCTVRGDLVDAMVELAKEDPPFDAVLIETTGLADPAPIAFSFNKPQVSHRFRIDSILCLVDAKHVRQHLHEDRAHDAINEAIHQVAFGDRILLNKVDLVTAGELQQVKAELRAINQFAEIIECQQAQVDLDRILGLSSYSLERLSDSAFGLNVVDDSLDGSLNDGTGSKDGLNDGSHDQEHVHSEHCKETDCGHDDHDHDHHDHDHGHGHDHAHTGNRGIVKHHDLSQIGSLGVVVPGVLAFAKVQWFFGQVRRGREEERGGLETRRARVMVRTQSVQSGGNTHVLTINTIFASYVCPVLRCSCSPMCVHVPSPSLSRHNSQHNTCPKKLLRVRGADLFRCKGLLKLDVDTSKTFVLQGVHEQLQLGEAKPKIGSSSAEEAATAQDASRGAVLSTTILTLLSSHYYPLLWCGTRCRYCCRLCRPGGAREQDGFHREEPEL